MTDPKDVPIDDGDRTAGGGIIDRRTDGTADSEGKDDEPLQTGVNEVVNGRYGSDVD
jgi:hypothetical protein